MRFPLFAALAWLAVAVPAQAVVIVEQTWRAEGGEELAWERGFSAHEALAAQPQFSAMVALSQDGGKEYGVASGVWIGNADGRAYILTAAHVFDDGSTAKGTQVRTASGQVLRGVRVWIHPRWDGDAMLRGGFDFAIIELNGAITESGDAPILYSGDGELGRRCVIVGYGSRGVAPFGHGVRFGRRHGDRSTAAENVVDRIEVENIANADGDWGNMLSIDLDEPGGAGKNRWGDVAPISPLEGILAPGDSGGSMWMQFEGRWRVVGVNSSGDPGADYQDASHFARIAGARDWITLVFPNARFAD